MSSSSMEHSSTLDPSGLMGSPHMVPSMRPTSTTGYRGTSEVTGATRTVEPSEALDRREMYHRGPVKVLMLAPFQYKYDNKSYWVSTGEWYSLDPIKDREEIIYLDSPSNPYRQFMYMEGHTGVGTQEEKGEVYKSGTDYKELAFDPPPVLRSNALLPAPDPAENPHILETLAKAGLTTPPSMVSLTTNPPVEPLGSSLEEETGSASDQREVVPTIPSEEAELPRYGDPVVVDEVIEAVVVEGIEEVPVPTAYEMREAELRSMKVGPLKSLATTMGLEYKDKETTIRQILDLE